MRHAGCNFLFLYCSCFVLVLGLKWPQDMSWEVFPLPLFYESVCGRLLFHCLYKAI